jgi:hypothetical protein
MFLGFLPLSTFKPTLPKWQHAFKTKQSPLTKLRAGGSSRGHSKVRSGKEAAPAGSSPLEIIYGHTHMKSEKGLLCDLCRGAQTSLRCRQCGVYFCNPATGWQCMIEHMWQGVEGVATVTGKCKRADQKAAKCQTLVFPMYS